MSQNENKSVYYLPAALWTALLAISMVACADSQFSGASKERNSAAGLNGGPVPDAGDGADGPFGPDSGDGQDSGFDGRDGGSDSDGGLDSDGGSDSDGGFDSDGGEDGKDGKDDDDDEDLGFDDDETSAKLREPITIQIQKAQNKPTLRIRTVTKKDDGEWKTAKLEKGTVTVEDICWKNKDTEVEITLNGHTPTQNLDGQPAMKIKGGGGSSLTLGYEDDGCFISFLAKDCHDNNVFVFSCPRNDLSIQDLF